MIKDYPELALRPCEADAEQCALKLWRLQSLFRQLAAAWALRVVIGRSWPALGLCQQRWFVLRQLELALQPEYLQDGREFYELRFRETRFGLAGLTVRHDFGCGRLLDDEILSSQRVTRQLEEKAKLLGMFGKGSRPAIEDAHWKVLLKLRKPAGK